MSDFAFSTDKYTLGKELGAGAEGVVRLCTNNDDGKGGGWACEKCVVLNSIGKWKRADLRVRPRLPRQQSLALRWRWNALGA